MTKELKTKIVVTMAGDVERMGRKYSQSLNQMTRNAQVQNSRLARSMNGVFKGIDKGFNKLNNRATQFAVGGGLLISTKQLGDYHEILTMIKTDGNLAADAMKELDRAFYETATRSGIKIQDMALAYKQLLESVGDADFSKANIDNLATAQKGFMVDPETSGKLIAMFKDNFGATTPEEIQKMLDIMKVHSEYGAVSPREIANSTISLASIFPKEGKTPEEAFREMSAIMQVGRKGSGSSAETATGVERVISALLDPDMQKFLHGRGIKLFEPTTLPTGETVSRMRALGDIFEGINNDTKKGETVDGVFLNQNAIIKKRIQQIPAFNVLSVFLGDLYEENRKLLKELENMDDVRLGAATEAATENAKSFNSALNKLANVSLKFADMNLAEPMEKFADMINSLDPKQVEEGLKTLGEIAKTIGKVFIAYKVATKGKEVFDFFKGVTGGGGGIPGVPDVQKVWVVNMDGMPGSDGTFSSKNKRGLPLPGGAAANVALMAINNMPTTDMVKEWEQSLQKYQIKREAYVQAYGKDQVNRAERNHPIGGEAAVLKTPEQLDDAMAKQQVIDSVGDPYARAAYRQHGSFFSTFRGLTAKEMLDILSQAGFGPIQEKHHAGKSGIISGPAYEPASKIPFDLEKILTDLDRQAEAIQTVQNTPPPEGTIRMQIELPEGVAARTTTESKNVDLRVNVGHVRSIP